MYDQKNTDILARLITGRTDPYIYAFSTDKAAGYLKVGDTYRPLNVRLNEWREKFPDLKEEFHGSARINESTIFRDYAVHKFLKEERGRQRLESALPEMKYFSNEFFKNATVKDIEDAINDIKSSYKANTAKYQFYSSSHIPQPHIYTRGKALTPRKNQQQVIDSFAEARRKGRTNLLMYAVMRFGKTFTSLYCALKDDARSVLVVSAKADVKEEWKKAVESDGNFHEYVFADKNTLLHNSDYINEVLSAGKRIVLFLSLQDLQGDRTKPEHKEVFRTDWNMLLIDETHFGARAEHYGKVLESAAESRRQMQGVETLDDLENNTKNLKTKVRIHLSGTPYRILMGSEFQKEDIIAFVQFSDIAEAQQKWLDENRFNDDFHEWNNPYFGFPQMLRFAFHPNQASIDEIERLKKAGATTSFSELFRPRSIVADRHEDYKQFVHTEAITDLLLSIDGTKEDANILGFLDNERIRRGQMCRHMVFVLPYCASCDAMEELLRSKSRMFRHLQEYQVINISGVDAHRRFPTTEKIKKLIADCEARGQKTITLTVNRMLTGNTVPQWDTMLFFKQCASAEEYDQAIYRLQNPYTREYRDENGETIRICMKPQTILVDFDPMRLFRLQERKSQIYNVNTDNNGNSRLTDRIATELKISPVITLDNNCLKEASAADIIDAVREYAATRSVYDEAGEVPIDMSLLENPDIYQEISRLNPLEAGKGLWKEAVEFDDDDEGDDVNPKTDNPDTDTPDSKHDRQSTDNDRDEGSDISDRFAAYYALILFYAFLTESEVKSLEDIISSADSTPDNRRIRKNLHLSSHILELIQRHINPYTLRKLDYKIHNINSLTRDSNKSPEDKAALALTKFGRMSDSEVVTPDDAADSVTGLLPDTVFESGGKILDIASKQGEFPLAIRRRFGEGHMKDVYVLCTSPLAYEFTRKVYRLLSMPEENIFGAQHTSYDLKDITSDLYATLKNMKFSVVIGNPPYQEIISGSDGNHSLAKQLYPHFIRTAISLSERYVSLITPSRWFTADAQDRSFIKLRKFFAENNHISQIYNFPNPSLLFSKDKVLISGGVNFFLYDKEHTGDVDFTETYGDGVFRSSRPLFEKDMDIIFCNSRNFSFVEKVRQVNGNEWLTDITQGRNAFGFVGKGIENITSTTPSDDSYEIRCRYEEIRYVPAGLIDKNKDIADKWKVFISKGNGGAGLLTDDKPVAILGVPYIGRPRSVCTDSLIPIGKFDTEYEAQALWKYLQCKFVRFMVGILKTSQNLYQPVYRFVPMQNFTSSSDIDWSGTIEEIDRQLYDKYGFTDKEREYLESKIKPL